MSSVLFSLTLKKNDLSCGPLCKLKIFLKFIGMETIFWCFEYNSLHTLGLQNKCLHVILLLKMSKKHKYENNYSQRSDPLWKKNAYNNSFQLVLRSKGELYLQSYKDRDLILWQEGKFLEVWFTVRKGHWPGQQWLYSGLNWSCDYILTASCGQMIISWQQMEPTHKMELMGSALKGRVPAWWLEGEGNGWS